MSVRGTKKRAVIFLLRYDILGSERRKFRISHVDPSLFQYFVEYLYSHRVFGIRLLQKCRPVCQYYEKYQMYDGVYIKGVKQPMVTG